MPHIIVEYSTNLEKRISVRKMVEGIHAAVLATGAFELGAVRTRTAPRDLFIVADGDPDNSFIHVELRIGPGRDVEIRKRVAEAVMAVLKSHTAAAFEQIGLGLSVEIREIDNSAAIRVNNLHTRMKSKTLP